MENFISSLPKPLLAFFAIVIGIALVLLMNPLHTVCDSQEEIVRDLQIGVLFPKEIKKSKIPPSLVRVKEACQVGNSPGSCSEYFSLLKKISKDVLSSSTECVAQLYGIKEISAALNDGIELMVRLAWGNKPPEMGPDKLGWLHEAEVATFCQLKNIYLQVYGDEAWNEFRLKIFNKLPGEELLSTSESAVEENKDPRKALSLMSEQEVFGRSLFSVSCETY